MPEEAAESTPSFGEFLKGQRELQNKTIEAVIEETGYLACFIESLESGKRKFVPWKGCLTKIARAYGVPFTHLLRFQPTERRYHLKEGEPTEALTLQGRLRRQQEYKPSSSSVSGSLCALVTFKNGKPETVTELDSRRLADLRNFVEKVSAIEGLEKGSLVPLYSVRDSVIEEFAVVGELHLAVMRAFLEVSKE